MDQIAVANKTLNPTVDSNHLAKVGIKVIVLTLFRDSQRSEDTHLTTLGPLSFLLEEA